MSDIPIDEINGFLGAEVSSVDRLAGDASSREYYRIFFADGQTRILMRAADSYAITQFREISALMRQLKATTPDLFQVNGSDLVLEDLGDVSLQEFLLSKVSSLEKLHAVYMRLIDDLIKFQITAVDHLDRRSSCFHLNFDDGKLNFETDFATSHFLKSFMGLKLDDLQEKELCDQWSEVNNELAEEMEVLCHRDFHSRNIMVTGDRRVWIDYQDARMGRLTYDLCSLIEDPYVDLPVELRDELVGAYYQLINEKDLAPWDKSQFLSLYRLSTLQRVYKALGTYGYQKSVMGNNAYLPYIVPAVKTFKRMAERSGKFGDLVTLIMESGKSKARE